MDESALQQDRRSLFVITAPSGGGKSTIVRRLLQEDAGIGYSRSTTTRPARPGEHEGKAYDFVTREQFQRLIDEGRFLEWAEVHGNLYGTRLDLVEDILDGGRDVVLDIDVQGAMTLRRKSADAVLIFLVPPSMEALERRLRGRAQDSEGVIARRLRNAQRELRAADRFDYLVLNGNLDEAVAEVKAIVEAERCRSSRRSIGGALAETIGGGDRPSASFGTAVVHAGKAMDDLLARAERVARTDSPVLILGESGTGKEVLAEAIHAAGSRAAGPLVRVNCGAIPATLLESELFGHVAGAFTGAVRDHPGLFRTAHEGTIFLDEIGELSLDLQVKLLRALQDGEVRPVGGAEIQRVDVRVIAATNRNLEAEVAAGRFRKDLYYRLNVVALRLPPLRERREDVPVLVEHFLHKLMKRTNASKTIEPEAMEVLAAFDWPGNVRQLENAIEHAVVMSRTNRIGRNDLPPAVRFGKRTAATAATPVIEGANLHDIEKATILAVLQRNRNNLTHAARELGLTRRALSYRLDKYGLDVKRRRGRPRKA